MVVADLKTAADVQDNLVQILNWHNKDDLDKILSRFGSELDERTTNLIEQRMKYLDSRYASISQISYEAQRIQKQHDAAFYSSYRDRMGHFSNWIKGENASKVALERLYGQKGRTNEITDLVKATRENEVLLKMYRAAIEKQSEAIESKTEEINQITKQFEDNGGEEAMETYRQLIAQRTAELERANRVLRENHASTSSDLYNVLAEKQRIRDEHESLTDANERLELLARNGVSSIGELVVKMQEMEEVIQDLENGDEVSGITESINLATEQLEEQNELLRQRGSLQEELNDLNAKNEDLLEKHNNLLNQNKENNEKINKLVQKRADTEERINSLLRAGKDITSGFGGILGGIVDFAKQCATAWIDIDDSAFKLGKTLGMNRQQAQAYRASLLRNNFSLMAAYGKTNEQLMQLQENYSNAINNVTLLNTKQMEGAVAMGQFIGDDNVMQSVTAFDQFGADIGTAMEYMATTNERAKMYGLNAQKSAAAFKDNIKLASQYTFRDGINGISRMTMLSQRLRFNMQSLGGVIDKFSTIQGAIEASAQLQVLGGSAAANFGNPLEMMNMALTDGEAVMDKIVSTFEDMGKFNAKTGMIDISSFNKTTMKAIAEGMGVSYEDAFNVASQKAKQNDIDTRSGVNGRFTDQSQKDWIYNNAQWDADKQKWYVNYFDDNGKQQKINVDQLNGRNIDKIRQTSSKEEMMQDDVHAMRMHFLGRTERRAKGMVSMKQDLASIMSQGKTALALAMDPVMATAANMLRNANKTEEIAKFLKGFANTVGGWMEKAAEFMKWLMNYLQSHSWAMTIAKVIGGAFLLNAIGLPIGKLLKAGFSLGKGGIKGLISLISKGAPPPVDELAVKGAAGKFAQAEGASALESVAGRPPLTPRESELLEQYLHAKNKYDRVVANNSGGKALSKAESKVAKAAEEFERVSGRSVESIETGAAETATRSVGAEATEAVGSTAARSSGRVAANLARGARFGGKFLRYGALASIIEAPLAMYDTHLNNQQYESEQNAINQRYGNYNKSNLESRLENNGASFYAEADKKLALSDADRRRNNANAKTWSAAGGAAVGAGIGTAIGTVIPGLGNVAGFIVGGLLGTALGAIGGALGRYVAKKNGTKVSDDEVIGREGLAQRNFEDTKIGLANIKTKEDLMKQAAIATVGIHDLLISWHNENNHLSREGLTEDQQKEKKKQLEVQKKARYEAEHKDDKPWWKFWSTGGVVHAAEGDVINAAFAKKNRRGSDTVPSMLTPGEMVLNSKQQKNLWDIVNGVGTYTQPTKIAQAISDAFRGKMQNVKTSHDINININISGNGNLQGLDTKAIQNAILDPSTIKRLHEALDRVSNQMFNGGSMIRENSQHKLTHV